jgi:hypothetical protein
LIGHTPSSHLDVAGVDGSEPAPRAEQHGNGPIARLSGSPVNISARGLGEGLGSAGMVVGLDRSDQSGPGLPGGRMHTAGAAPALSGAGILVTT